MKYFKTAFCIALLLVAGSVYANTKSFCQSPDSLCTEEKPVYAEVLKNAYAFLFFSPYQDAYSSPTLLMNSGWEYDGTQNFQRLKIFADDYITNHYGKFIFEMGEAEDKTAFFVNFFEGTIEPIFPQENGYGPQDDDDIDMNKEIVISYHLDNDKIVPFARYGTSELCYISLQDKYGDWHFIFLHSGILCF